MAENRVSSILTADFGSVQTRVNLFDIVDGEYRVIAHQSARTTLGYPDDDLGVGLKRMLERMTQLTGRQFFSPVGRVLTPEDNNRNGVDYFITTSSAGRPLRVIVVGLIPEISVLSALRAISGTYVDIVAEFHLRDNMSETDRLNAIVLGRPDLIFVSGGANDGAENPLENILDVVQLGLKVMDSQLRPPLLYAGNNDLQPEITEMFSDLTKVLFSQNIRPSMSREQLDAAQSALATVYDDYRDKQGKAFSDVGAMSSTGFLPTAQSYALVAEYFSKVLNGNVIALDVGSTSSVLVGAFNGQTSTSISTSKGLGHSASALVSDVGENAITTWLPFYPSSGEIRNYALNKLARPASIPMNLRDMFIEQGMMRASVSQMLADARPLWKDVPTHGLLPSTELIIIGGGALTGTGHPTYDMMMVADCLQPTGVTQIKADTMGIIPSMDALAHVQPDAVVQLLDGNNLEQLGTLISLEGQAKKGATAAKLIIKTDDEKVKVDLKSEELLALPLPNNYSLTITIRCKGNFRVNGKRNLNLTLSGGTGGILLDARGRNLSAPNTVEDRIRLLPLWISNVTDDPLMEIPEDWYFKPEEAMPEVIEEVVAAPEPASIDIEELAQEEDVFAFDDVSENNDTLVLDDEDDDDDGLGSLRDLLD